MQQKIGVRFKIGSKVYSFLSEDIDLNIKDYVIVETSLGEGYGKVEKIEEYNPAKENRELKKILRKATKEDEKQHEKMLEKERIAINETKELAKKLNLDMNVVNAEYSLDGTKVIIDFIAEDRVDFRDLVKELATKLKSRIELRQIGIRDQAKMVGGIGICGRVCCCSAYLKDFEKVSIKMAKSQGLALNPTKISGSCGRLMCCLAYEDNYYSEVYPKIPKLNKEVKTPDGIGIVTYTNALKQIASVKITSKDGSFVIKDFSLDDIKSVANQDNSSSLQDYKKYNEANKQQNNNEIKKDSEQNTEKQNGNNEPNKLTQNNKDNQNHNYNNQNKNNQNQSKIQNKENNNNSNLNKQRNNNTLQNNKNNKHNVNKQLSNRKDNNANKSVETNIQENNKQPIATNKQNNSTNAINKKPFQNKHKNKNFKNNKNFQNKKEQ